MGRGGANNVDSVNRLVLLLVKKLSLTVIELNNLKVRGNKRMSRVCSCGPN